MAKNNITVDEFVKTKVLPKYQPIVEELQRLIHWAAPDATEVMSYGIPNYRGKRGLAVISPARRISRWLSHVAQNSKISTDCLRELGRCPRILGLEM
jgi:hypothetical protein